MELGEAEDFLVERLNAPRDSAKLHLSALANENPSSLSEVAAVGLDTNVLKFLRRDPTFAELFALTLRSNGVALIVPGQSVVEYWNNHRVFAGEEWNAFATDLTRMSKKIEGDSLQGQASVIEEIRRLVQGVSDDLQESKAPEYLSKSRDLIKAVLENASTPRVSRTRLGSLASVRFSSKTPPGFADDKSKSAPWGDFFVWCDFLLGALTATVEPGRAKYAWITDDSKPDWKAGGFGHPSLLEEFEWVCGGQLSILSSADAVKLVKDQQARESAAQTDAEDELED